MSLENITLWTALVTPFDSHGKIDFPALKNILKEQESAGNGILLLGSTGEALNMGLDDRKAVIEFGCLQKLSVPLMAGIGGAEYDETKKWVEYLETQAIDAYLMVVPLYAKPGPEGQYQWFKGLLDVATRPTVLYNVPSRTGMPLAFDALKKLVEHPRFFGVKEASGSAEEFAKYAKICAGKKMYSGDDALLPAFAPHGASGLISVAGNAWPKETALYVKQVLANSFQDPELWLGACDSMFEASNPIPVKRLMAHNKQINSSFLKLPLIECELASLDKQLSADQNIKNWYQNQEQI